MKNNNQIKNDKLQRLINREKRRKKAKMKLAAIGLVAIFSVTGVYIFASRENNAKADTAKLLASTQETSDENTIYSLEKDKDKFTDILLAYKKVIVDSDVYHDIVSDPKTQFKLSSGEYVKYYGEENGWVKVMKNGEYGYIQTKKLENVEENELVVKNGILLDAKDYIFPQDFETVFDIEVENSMLVMFEAMKRDGMHIGVSRKTIDNVDFKQDANQNYAVPDYSNHTLRTGKSIELEIPNTAENIDFKKTIQGEWLKEHAYEYGFILRYPEGKEDITGFFADDRIYRYVGVENAKKMHENNLSFEEYFNIVGE